MARRKSSRIRADGGSGFVTNKYGKRTVSRRADCGGTGENRNLQWKSGFYGAITAGELGLYIELPNQMLGYIERSTGEEQKQLYEKYFDLLSVEDVESTLIRLKCAAIHRKRKE